MLSPELINEHVFEQPQFRDGRNLEADRKRSHVVQQKALRSVGWLMMGVKSLLGMLGSDKAYQSLFKHVLENYNKEFDPSFTATDAMVENVRAEPVNKTRSRIVEYPPLKDYRFPIMITYGQKDIYGESKQGVQNRFPRATFVEYENEGHIAWKHNDVKFNSTLTDFYRLR